MYVCIYILYIRTSKNTIKIKMKKLKLLKLIKIKIN